MQSSLWYCNHSPKRERNRVSVQVRRVFPFTMTSGFFSQSCDSRTCQRASPLARSRGGSVIVPVVQTNLPHQ